MFSRLRPLVKGFLPVATKTTSADKLLTSSDRKEFLYSIINDKHVKELLKDGKYKSAQTKVKKMLREWS